MATNLVHSNMAIPPGEYLEEVIHELGMTKDELARRMDRPAAKLSPMFKGEKAITPETALQLEKVLGVPAHIWTGLEAEYRLTLARQEEEDRRGRLREETGLVSAFCYNHLVKIGAVAKHTNPLDQVLEMQRFFGVTSLKRVLELRRYRAVFRRSGPAAEYAAEVLAAWLRLGEKRAQSTECAPFSKVRLMAALPELRSMTRRAPDDFQGPLRRSLSEAGVALVICPHFPGTRAHGATFWLGHEKAALMATIRGRWADIFWFSLFHEVGHILLHSRQEVILEDGRDDPDARKLEEEADRFASDYLIPPDQYESFVKRGSFYHTDLEQFAERIGIQPGIVVGRLQHDGYLRKQWRNGLRTRYTWANDQ